MKSNKMDYPLLIITLILVSFGLLMVFSSSYYYAIDKMQNKTHFFTTDLKWIILGVIAMLVASAVDYKIYKKLVQRIKINKYGEEKLSKKNNNK